LRSFPFGEAVARFIEEHEQVFLVEQNRDAQMRSLLVNELGVAPECLHSILHYDGMPLTARFIQQSINTRLTTRSEAAAVVQVAEGRR
jgi:2-oxoglutarate ferredoxin oxidoreductase subunit alpha